MFLFKPEYRHIKRGTEYMILCESRLQSSDKDDYAEMVTYIGKEGDIWTRKKSEFFDGRFEKIHDDENGLNI